MTINVQDNGNHIEVDATSQLCADAKRRRFLESIAGAIDSAFFAVLLIVYIVLSLTLKNPAPSGLNAWAVWWVLILLGDVPSSIMRAIFLRKFSVFPIWALAGFAFLFLGMYYGLWNPEWVILLAIPAYYCIFSPIDKLISDHKKGRI
jgi:hypothetical protein